MKERPAQIDWVLLRDNDRLLFLYLGTLGFHRYAQYGNVWVLTIHQLTHRLHLPPNDIDNRNGEHSLDTHEKILKI